MRESQVHKQLKRKQFSQEKEIFAVHGREGTGRVEPLIDL